MAIKGGTRQSSCNAGELDRLLAGRVDIKQYYSGGLAFANIEPVPQSGFRDMGGTRDNGPVRGRISSFAATDIAISPGPHTGTQTIWSGSVDQPVAAVHVADLGVDDAVHTARVEVEINGSWVQVGPDLAIGTTAKTRTFARAPGNAAVATGVRIRVEFASSASATPGTVTVLTEASEQDHPRYGSLHHDTGERYNLSLQPQFLDIFEDDVFRAGVWLPVITVDVQPQVDFYSENATIGLFERTIRSQRIRRAGSAQEWTVDEWPFEGVPKVDLGGVYSKSDDEWEIYLRWTESGANETLYLVFAVNGEKTPGIPLRESNGDPVNVGSLSGDWDAFATEIETALGNLPSLGPGISASWSPRTQGRSRKLMVTFGGDLSGSEYQVDAMVTSTANISALPVHVEVGKTDFEPLLSSGRGWPGVTGLVQDRIAYGDIRAEPGALSLSQAAEYFNINIEAQGANAARLDRLRAGQTAERILAIKDATYLLVFTDQSVHFAANRTITRTDPLNFTITSETGIAPNTEPVDLEGKIYFVARNDDEDAQDGNQILSLSYDELISKFDASPESLLASHLVRRIMRTKRQKSGSDTDASRMWLLRSDGLLLAAQVIRSQEILGLCRWHAAAGGIVCEIDVDRRNRLRMCVSRGGRLRHERLDPSIFLHATVSSSCDLSGQVSGLDLHEGREVWAVAQDYTLGPFTVTGGVINLGDAYSGPVLVGLFQPPLYESMPRWRILPNDEIVKRPGRVHSVLLDVIGTTSIAVGANGQPPRDISLARIGDPADGPTPPATRKIHVSGLLGMKDGTTLVVTQIRPGRLQVRDFVIEEKL